MEGQKAQLVLLPVWRVNDESLAYRMALRLQLVWKRGPLTPPVVVVVGEGQVNLVYDWCSRCSCHGQSLQTLWDDPFDDESNRSVFRLRL